MSAGYKSVAEKNFVGTSITVHITIIVESMEVCTLTLSEIENSVERAIIRGINNNGGK